MDNEKREVSEIDLWHEDVAMKTIIEMTEKTAQSWIKNGPDVAGVEEVADFGLFFPVRAVNEHLKSKRENRSRTSSVRFIEEILDRLVAKGALIKGKERNGEKTYCYSLEYDSIKKRDKRKEEMKRKREDFVERLMIDKCKENGEITHSLSDVYYAGIKYLDLNSASESFANLIELYWTEDDCKQALEDLCNKRGKVIKFKKDPNDDWYYAHVDVWTEKIQRDEEPRKKEVCVQYEDLKDQHDDLVLKIMGDMQARTGGKVATPSKLTCWYNKEMYSYELKLPFTKEICRESLERLFKNGTLIKCRKYADNEWSYVHTDVIEWRAKPAGNDPTEDVCVVMKNGQLCIDKESLRKTIKETLKDVDR